MILDIKNHDFVETDKSKIHTSYQCKNCKTRIRNINNEWEVCASITRHEDKQNAAHWFNIEKWPEMYLDCRNLN